MKASRHSQTTARFASVHVGESNKRLKRSPFLQVGVRIDWIPVDMNAETTFSPNVLECA
jgi:hypothetical protein